MAPGHPGAPLDLRDFLPRFLTEEHVPGSDERTNGQTASRRTADDGRLPRGTLTILVTDMVGSTALAEQLGDRKWWEILQAHNAFVRAQVDRHGGIEVKAQGDGFLVVFASARGRRSWPRSTSRRRPPATAPKTPPSASS